MNTGNDKVVVLIAEDSPTQAEQLRHLLEAQGYAVHAASNGREALSMAREIRPVIIITDVVMPEMDGYALSRAIKSDAEMKDIPVILVTQLSNPGDVLSGLECGADNFITKPYDEKYLLARIRYVLANREIRRSEKTQVGVEIFFGNKKYFIAAERQQILGLLISTYEAAVEQNLELARTQNELRALNEKLEELVEERTAALADRIKELTCLYGVSSMRQKPDEPPERVMRSIVEALPPGWQYPEIACARIVLEGREYATGNFEESPWSQSAPILVGGEPAGTVEVRYLEERPERDDGPFIREERDLIDEVARQIGFFVERGRAQEKLRHTNLLLRAIRAANQLITREGDRERLIRGACDCLVSTRGLDGAWIALVDESGGVSSLAEAGIGKDFAPLAERIERGKLPACARLAAGKPGAVIVQDMASQCGDCPMAGRCHDGGAIASRLEHGGQVHGFLVASGPTSLMRDCGEVGLFEEVAADIALGLSSIRREERRSMAEEALRESEQRYSVLFESCAEGIIVADVETKRFVFVNPAICRMLGYGRDELMRLGVADVHPPASLEYVIDRFEAQSRGEIPLVSDLPCLRKDGSVIYADVCAAAAVIGGRKCNMGFFTDVTDRRKAEEERRLGIQRLEATLKGTIQAISNIVEMRDPYTAGHQRRVSELARAMVIEMGFEEERVEGVRLAGSIHDLGKIYVPAEILSKPGRLTKNEFQIIQEHCRAGYEILKEVEFSWPIAQIVLQHHERMDGSGYPAGLSGGDVLKEAAVIAVADVVEAMASHRPYRPGLGIEAALDEVTRHRGTMFDAEAVDACLKVFKEKGFKFY
jgi:PAS domain S-box-containing protein